MSLPGDKNPDRYALPLGAPMSMSDLPPPETKRWVSRRKAEVLAGIRLGLITMEEACERYMLSVEELLSWQHQLDNYGIRGLKVTKVQEYRKDVTETER
jgi:hypothetical protein